MTYDIITLGSATLDIFADTFDRKHLNKEEQKMRYEHLIAYHVGSKLLINELNLSVGGGGTNTALTFSKFGFKTAFCGALGKDSTAAIIRTYLEDNNIAFIGPIVDQKTNISLILDSIEHDRTILVYKEASDSLELKHIPDLKNVKLIYSSSMMGKSFETFKKIIKKYSNKVLIAFNPSEYQAKQGYQKLKYILENIDFLILNKEEAQDILNDFEPDMKVLIRKLKKKLNKEAILIITDGANGAFALKDKIFYQGIPKKSKIIETTGAGDAFASAFIGSYLKNKDIEEGIKLGLANSESVITHKGAKEIILTYEEANKLSKKKRYKILKEKIQ